MKVQLSASKLQLYYKQLKSKIRKYNYYYYVLAQPLISDAAYDTLYRTLQQFEIDYAGQIDTRGSPTTEIGTDLTQKLRPRRHIAPMLSLANAWQEDEILRFSEKMARVGAQKIVCEPKLDGMAISLFYRRGQLRYALTRGDGRVGEDITRNVQYLANLPLKLQGHQVPDRVYLRGEVVLPLKAFTEINATLIQQQQKTFAQPRNVVAGILRHLKPNIALLQQCTFYAYSLLNSDHQEHHAALADLKTLGFTIIEHSALVHNDGAALYAYAQKIQHLSLPYDLDGVVYKVNDYSIQAKIGHTATAPRWALAYKFANKTFKTRIKAITFQVGRTGTCTPVALVEPLLIDGVRVTKANLHNIDYLKTKQIGVGNEILIKRAGGVIPTVVRSIPDLKQPCMIPLTCSSCQRPLLTVNKRLFCNAGMQCPAQAKEYMTFFAAKPCFNIRGLSHQLVGLLYDTGKVQSPIDLFRLTPADLLTLPTFGTKKAHNLCHAITVSRQITLARLLYALGIEGVGTTIAQTLAQHFGSFQMLSTASLPELLTVKKIGPELAQALTRYFSQAENQAYLAALLPLVVIRDV